MQVNFGEISTETSSYTLEEDSWLPVGGATVSRVRVARIAVRLKGENAAVLTGRLAVDLELECGRCGQSVAVGVDEEFHYLLTTEKEEFSGHPERECSDEECDTLYLTEPVIDIAEILREQLILALPGKVVCDEACLGICPECGGVVNLGECSCPEKVVDSPFAVLQKLKKD